MRTGRLKHLKLAIRCVHGQTNWNGFPLLVYLLGGYYADIPPVNSGNCRSMFNINRKHGRQRPPEGREVAHHVGQPASASCSALSGPPGNHLTLELKASQSLRTNRKFNHCSKGRFLQNDWFLIEVTKKHKVPTQQSPPDVGQTLLETCSAAHHADRSASASCWARFERPVTTDLSTKGWFRMARMYSQRSWIEQLTPNFG